MVNKRGDQSIKAYTWQDIDKCADTLTKDIIRDGHSYSGVYGIPRGGVILATLLSHRLDIPYLSTPTPGCLIVDDIADSGNTLRTLLESAPSNCKVATIDYKVESIIKPTYYVNTVDNKTWITYPWEKK